MSSISDLSDLIKSLSKSEKRYFRLQTGIHDGEKAYLHLFELLSSDQMVEIDMAFKARFPKSDLEMARKHLYQALLKSLRSYANEKSIENKLMNSLGNIHILFGKGAYKLCFEEIDRAKQKALEFEKFLFYTMYSKVELEIISHLGYQGSDESKLLNINTQAIQLLEQEINVIRHGSLYYTLHNRYLKEGHTREPYAEGRLNDLLLEEFQLMTKGNVKTFESEKSHLLFQASYYLMTANPKAGLQVFKELNELFLSHKNLWKESPLHYLYMADGILAEMCLVGAHDLMQDFIIKLSALEVFTETIALFIEAISIKYKLQISYYLANPEDGMAILKIYHQNLEPKLHLVPSQIAAGVIYSASLACFGMQQYKDALRFINLIVNQKATFVSSQIHSISRILYLFIHLELENFDVIGYDIRSFERVLKKERYKHSLESNCIRFIRNWINTTDKKNAALIFKSQLDGMLENPAENRLYKQLPIAKWLHTRYGL